MSLVRTDIERLHQIKCAPAARRACAKEAKDQPEVLVKTGPLTPSQRHAGGIARFADKYARPVAGFNCAQTVAGRSGCVSRAGAREDLVARAALVGLVAPRASRIGSGMKDERHSFLLEAVERKGRKNSAGGSAKANFRVARVAFPNLEGRSKFMIPFALLGNPSCREIAVNPIAWTKFEALRARSAFRGCKLRPNPFLLDVDQRNVAFRAGVSTRPAPDAQIPVDNIFEIVNPALHNLTGCADFGVHELNHFFGDGNLLVVTELREHGQRDDLLCN